MIAKKKPSTLSTLVTSVISILLGILALVRKKNSVPAEMIFEVSEEDVLSMVQSGGSVVFKDIRLKGVARVTIKRNLLEENSAE